MKYRIGSDGGRVRIYERFGRRFAGKANYMRFMYFRKNSKPRIWPGPAGIWYCQARDNPYCYVGESFKDAYENWKNLAGVPIHYGRAHLECP
jgi:hypothetical protein